MHDVIVIGAGPAGSTVARLAAEAGLDVLILDRSAFPRVKPCGGGLTTRALELLPPGYADQIRAQPTEWIFEGRGPGARTAVVTARPYSHIVQRQTFDSWLLNQAAAAGALVHTAETVASIEPDRQTTGYRIQTNRGSYQTRYLVGADGAHGVTGRLLGFSRPKNGAAIEVEVEVTPAVYQQWAHSVTINIAKYPWGYAWVIPRDPILNLGVGSFRANRLPMRPLLADWVAQKLGVNLNGLSVLAHPLPYRYQSARLSKGHALLIGDAAGLMDTLSAEGIYSALLSATLAAQTLIQAAANQDDLSAYDRELQHTLWPNLRAAAKIGLMFYPLPGFWTKLFLDSPAMIEQYLRVAQGDAPYASLMQMGQRALLKKAHLGTLSHGYDSIRPFE